MTASTSLVCSPRTRTRTPKGPGSVGPGAGTMWSLGIWGRLSDSTGGLLPVSVRPVRLRESVRALILDEADRVLLVRFDWEGLEVPGGFWANPGGGIEPGEDPAAAMARELDEEVGLTAAELGPEVWTKTALFPMTEWDGQVDHIHLVRVEHFTPRPRLTDKQLRAENVQEIRWWTPEEVRRAEVTFAPRALPELLHQLLASGPPEVPVILSGF